MNVEIVKVGDLQCNCYLLDIDGDILVIDPGDEFDKIKNRIGGSGGNGRYDGGIERKRSCH